MITRRGGVFKVLALEHFGIWGKDAEKFLGEVFQLAYQKTDTPKSIIAAEFWQESSAVLHKYNALSMLERTNLSRVGFIGGDVSAGLEVNIV